MAEITIQNYHDCYEYGKRCAEEDLDIGTAAYQLEKTGMDIGSAKMYVRCVKAMLAGERYTSTVKELATSYFLTQIYSEYGAEGLKKALESVRQHLEYQKSYNGLSGIKKIYDEFMDIL